MNRNGGDRVFDGDLCVRVKSTIERSVLARPRNGLIGIAALVIAALLTVFAPSAAAAAGSDTRS
jgi:hypothetical protein